MGNVAAKVTTLDGKSFVYTGLDNVFFVNANTHGDFEKLTNEEGEDVLFVNAGGIAGVKVSLEDS